MQGERTCAVVGLDPLFVDLSSSRMAVVEIAAAIFAVESLPAPNRSQLHVDSSLPLDVRRMETS
jgi:hypothetical protein